MNPMKKIAPLNPWTAALTVAGFVSMASVLHADENAPAATTNTNQTQEATAPPAATPAPLMAALGKAGIAGPLNKAGINLYGYVEGGYMRDFSAPNSYDGPTYMSFNSYKNTGILDKISLNVERTVDPTKKQFDMGFRLEGIYGTDAKFIHSDGLADTQTTGRYQWDPLQAYVDVAFPGAPVRLRVGKWIELAGFRAIQRQHLRGLRRPGQRTLFLQLPVSLRRTGHADGRIGHLCAESSMDV
jgi:hypothetical protein